MGAVPEAYFQFVMDYAPYVYVIPPNTPDPAFGQGVLAASFAIDFLYRAYSAKQVSRIQWGRETLRDVKSILPSAVTAVRLALVLPLVYLINNGLQLFGALLFFSLIFTDFFDGYLARKLGVSSKFGAYFDATADFILILCLFATFIPVGFCADWVLLVIVAVFVEFVLTSQILTVTYDPVGKYYGSLLFVLIGLRFFLSGQLFYDIITAVATISAVASILSRATFIYKESQRLSRVRDKRVEYELLLTHYVESHGRIAGNADR